jgi:hypothetical protein
MVDLRTRASVEALDFGGGGDLRFPKQHQTFRPMARRSLLAFSLRRFLRLAMACNA